jgi:Contractile injection system tube protein
MAEGNLSKLQIISYKDDRFQEQDKSISVPVNPDKYSRSIKVEYNQEQEQGTQGNNPPFNRTPPEELQFEFLFDGTGVVPGSKDIQAGIEEFKKTVYKIEGDIHRPNFLKLIWGDLSFNCVLKELKIDFTLFKPDGTPLRAMVNATFMQVVDEKRRSAEQGKNSPDLTHIRYVKEGDTLPYMSYKIYGDASYYIQVAKYNGLKNFRNIRPNMKIVFPPIDKTAR